MKKKKKWVACALEADYFGDDRKIQRSERKRASAKDRSKYKKTDLIKQKKAELFDPADYLRGRVLSIISQGINVEHQGELVLCVLKGILKKEKNQMKNLITVGDFVLFEKTSEKEGIIVQVDERHSVLSRADHLHQRREQLIAANIDQVFITVSVVNPALKPALVDRYIIAARKGNMRPVIIINKVDLLKPDTAEYALYHDFINAWKNSGVTILSVSATTNQGMDELREMMKDKASVFSGQSGVGKSSLINAMTEHVLKTGIMTIKTQKGSHTTTQAQLLPLEFGGWVIDTPGIRSFGVWDLDPAEVKHYFPEIQSFGEMCRYPNCSHLNETDCAVINAVETGEILPLRYGSYVYLMESLKEQHRPR